MATLTRLLVLLHMRKSARAGAAAQSAAPSVESASSRPAILFMSMGERGFRASYSAGKKRCQPRPARGSERLARNLSDSGHGFSLPSLALRPIDGASGAGRRSTGADESRMIDV